MSRSRHLSLVPRRRNKDHLNLLDGPRAASWTPSPLQRPCRDQRVKVRWTDVMIARFKIEAMRCADNVELAQRLGLPAYCHGAMRAARSRYFRHATVKAPSRPTGRPRALQMALAA